MNIDRYMADAHLTLPTPVLGELRVAQRLLRLAPRYDDVAALKHAGYQSAQSIYFAGRAGFVTRMAEGMGGPLQAGAAFDSAESTYATALTWFGRHHPALNGVSPAAMPTKSPTQQQLVQYPNLQSLFGSLDYRECPDCRSVYSPAAYLVDLLQFLKARPVAPVAQYPNGARNLLFGAAAGSGPDRAQLLEHQRHAAVHRSRQREARGGDRPPPSNPNDPNALPFLVRDTTGTSEERRAMPQRVWQPANDKTAAVAFPLSLPFDLPFAETTEFLAGTGSSRSALLQLFEGTPSGTERCRHRGGIGAQPRASPLVTGTDAFQPWQRWGLGDRPTSR